MESRVGIATIRRIENTDKDARGHVSTYARIQTALEAAGVLFIDDDGTAGIGVRLIKTKKKKGDETPRALVDPELSRPSVTASQRYERVVSRPGSGPKPTGTHFADTCSLATSKNFKSSLALARSHFCHVAHV